jgi:hypothetical protein
VCGERGLCGFLANPRVQHARHIALFEFTFQTELKGSDQPHVSVQIDQGL